MSQVESSATEMLGRPAWFGLVLAQPGAAAIVCGLLLNVPQPLWWVGLGSAALLIGTVMSAAIIGKPVLWLAGLINRGLFKEVGMLATRNATRQPQP